MQPTQEQVWNGATGHAWVDTQELLDRMFAPFAERIVETVRGAKRVLDVGCGTGATSLALARHGSECVGVDISEPMLGLARERAAREGLAASFVLANAQDYAFEPASFDAVVSRFGVMFFDDSVKAFANLRSAAKEGALLRCISWRSPADNPFMKVAEHAAAPLIPEMPPRKPDGPGQFAFADPDKVRGILRDSGWNAIEITPIDVECVIPEADVVAYFTRLGPVGMVFGELDADRQAKVIATVLPAFAPYRRDGTVHFNAACWMIAAQR